MGLWDWIGDSKMGGVFTSLEDELAVVDGMDVRLQTLN